MKGKPFGLNPDAKYFFNSATHKRAISTLGYGLGQGQGFIVITGDSGSGKTMLMHALQHLLDKNQIVTGRVLNTQLQALDMLRYVAAEFNLPFENQSKVELIKHLESFFSRLREEHKRAVLIIDEAQNLEETSFDELRMLNNLIKGNENLLQIVLLGTRKLNEKLYKEELADVRRRIVATYFIGRLDQTETSAYIKHRLRTSGWLGTPTFSDEALIAIFDYTDGLPAQINLLCGRLILAAEVSEFDLIESDLVHDMVQEINEQFSENLYNGSLVDNVISALSEEKLARRAKENQAEVEPSETINARDETSFEMDDATTNDEQDVITIERTDAITRVSDDVTDTENQNKTDEAIEEEFPAGDLSINSIDDDIASEKEAAEQAVIESTDDESLTLDVEESGVTLDAAASDPGSVEDDVSEEALLAELTEMQVTATEPVEHAETAEQIKAEMASTDELTDALEKELEMLDLDVNFEQELDASTEAALAKDKARLMADAQLDLAALLSEDLTDDTPHAIDEAVELSNDHAETAAVLQIEETGEIDLSQQFEIDDEDILLELEQSAKSAAMATDGQEPITLESDVVDDDLIAEAVDDSEFDAASLELDSTEVETLPLALSEEVSLVDDDGIPTVTDQISSDEKQSLGIKQRSDEELDSDVLNWLMKQQRDKKNQDASPSDANASTAGSSKPDDTTDSLSLEDTLTN